MPTLQRQLQIPKEIVRGTHKFQKSQVDVWKQRYSRTMPIDPFHLDPDRHKPKVVEKAPLFHVLHMVAMVIVIIAGLAAAWVWGDLAPSLIYVKVLAGILGLIFLWRLKEGWNSDGIAGLWYAWHQPWGSSFAGDDPGPRNQDPLTSAIWWTGMGLIICIVAVVLKLWLQ